MLPDSIVAPEWARDQKKPGDAWGKLKPDERQVARASFSAMKDNAPANLTTWPARIAWWVKQSKGQRQAMRAKYISLGFVDDVGRMAENTLRQVKNTLKDPAFQGIVTAVSSAAGVPIKPSDMQAAANGLGTAQDLVHQGRATASTVNDAAAQVQHLAATIQTKAKSDPKAAQAAAKQLHAVITAHTAKVAAVQASPLQGYSVTLAAPGGAKRVYTMRFIPTKTKDQYTAQVISHDGKVSRSYTVNVAHI